MKKVFKTCTLAMLGLSTTFVACNKNTPTASSEKTNNQKLMTESVVLDGEDLSSEMLEFVDTITLTDEAGNVAKLLATSNDQAVLDEYKQDGELAFEIVNLSDIDVSSPSPVASPKVNTTEAIPTDNEAFVKFYVIESPVSNPTVPTANMQVMCFKSGWRHRIKTNHDENAYPKYNEFWSNLGHNAKVDWVTGNYGIEVEVEAKDCGMCSKYWVGGTSLYSTNSSVHYHDSDWKRVYVRVKSMEKNRNVYIW